MPPSYGLRLWNSLHLMNSLKQTELSFPNYQGHQRNWIFHKCPIIGFKVQVPYQEQSVPLIGKFIWAFSLGSFYIALLLTKAPSSVTESWVSFFLWMYINTYSSTLGLSVLSNIILSLLALGILGTQCSRCGAQTKGISITWEMQTLRPDPRSTHFESTF